GIRNGSALSVDEAQYSSVDEAQWDNDTNKETSPAETKTAEVPEDNEDEIQCDWICCKPRFCQLFARPSCLLLWLSVISYAQGMLLNGFLNSVLTSIERRFDLQSVEAGMIASTYDIGACLAIVPITYYGRLYRRSRFISVGAFVVATGSFLFSSPYFIAGKYVYQSQVEPVCYADGVEYPEFCVKQNQNYFKWVFWAAQLLHGMGGAPFFTLAVSYLDDNLSIKESGVFLGLYYLVGLVGPASGYLLGGIIVNIYVDLDKPKELSPDDTNLWVGAWWIGFLISGSISLMGVLPMFGFPKSFRGSARKRAARTEESYGDSAQRSAQLTVTMKDFLPTAGIIFSIPTFVCLTLAGTAASITITGLATFGPKLMQQFFRMAASTATLTIGLVSVPCGALGLFTGAMVIRFVAMPVQRLIWMNVGASTIALALVSSFVVRCSPQLLAGVTAPYPETQFVPDMDPNFSAPCNYNCSCVRNKFMFDPVCSADGVLHFSPCFAGCSGGNDSFSIDGKRYYTNCSCVTTTKLMHDRNISAISGDCPSTECTSAPLFLTLVGCFMFCMFFITIPTLQAIMRNLKDFGIGIQILTMRLLGSIPAPLLLGRLIDTTCSVWNSSCGLQGSCVYYNAHWLWVLILLFAGGL
uniref:Solute carrier organic anion transporter family member n=1 Tax=Macrostomum lignano TaxID=282301 RepID=A0A1I8GAU4_9PLAT